MRFPNDDAAKWSPRPTLKSAPSASSNSANGANGANDDVVHHNTLNATGPSHDEAARSREVERFFDLMTTHTPAQGTPR